MIAYRINPEGLVRKEAQTKELAAPTLPEDDAEEVLCAPPLLIADTWAKTLLSCDPFIPDFVSALKSALLLS